MNAALGHVRNGHLDLALLDNPPGKRPAMPVHSCQEPSRYNASPDSRSQWVTLPGAWLIGTYPRVNFVNSLAAISGRRCP